MAHQARTTNLYDANGNLVRAAVEDLTGGDVPRVTEYTYDAADRQTSVTDPEGGVMSRTFDPAGNVATVTYAEGRVTETEYDARNLPVRVTLRGFVDDPVGGSAPRDLVRRNACGTDSQRPRRRAHRARRRRATGQRAARVRRRDLGHRLVSSLRPIPTVDTGAGSPAPGSTLRRGRLPDRPAHRHCDGAEAMSGIVRDFITLIDRFLSGDDTSLRAANEMEAILLENFTEEDWFDDASLALAQYAPGGGEHLLDEAALADVLKEVKADLEADPG